MLFNDFASLPLVEKFRRMRSRQCRQRMRERFPRREGLEGPCVHEHLTNFQERGKRPRREGRQGFHPKPEIIDTLYFKIKSIINRDSKSHLGLPQDWLLFP